MFSSVLFRKFFFSILLIVLSFFAATYFFSVPLIRQSVYGIEEASARTILDNVYKLVRSEYLGIEAYRQSAIEARKRQLRDVVLLAESFVESKYQQYQEGMLTEAEARQMALDQLRTLRYGPDDYIWVSDYDSVLISHPDPRMHLADYSLVRDQYGKRIVPSVVKAARENGAGFTSYWWRRLENEAFIEKLTYSKVFPQWQWVIATGVYLDDVENEVARRKEKMIGELRQILREIRIARTGYMYIFDSGINMIIHPNPNIEHRNFSDMLNPMTRNPIGEELIEIAHTSDPKLYYKWDKPDDKGRYVYEKISWVKYFKEFDWYIASSVYTEELNITALMLRNRILLVSGVMLLLFLSAATLFLNKLLIPIRELARMALIAKDGDLSVRYKVSAEKGEVAVLATAFNSMIIRLRDNIRELDEKVHERTCDLVRANEQLMQEMEERTQAEEAMRKSKDRDQSILENIEDGYFETDLDGNLTFFNKALCRNLGYAEAELFGMSFRTFSDVLNAKKVFAIFEKIYETGKPATAFDWKLLKKDGSVCYVETSATLIRDAENRPMGFRGIARDVTERKATERELAYLAYHDPLTGLYNRKAFLEKLEIALHGSRSSDNERAVLYLDLDRFKQVNDTYGHEIGDRLLKEVGRRLKKSVRETDLVSRFGGDEFTIILMNHMAATRHEQVARRIRENLSQPYHFGEASIDFITPSIGISIYPKDGQDIETLLKCADMAMYQAKKEQNRHVFYGDIMINSRIK